MNPFQPLDVIARSAFALRDEAISFCVAGASQ